MSSKIPNRTTRVCFPLLVFSAFGALHCSSSDTGSGTPTPQAGSTASAGSAAGGSSTAGSPAAGSPSAAGSSVGGAGTSVGGAAATGGGGASAGSSPGGSAGSAGAAAGSEGSGGASAGASGQGGAGAFALTSSKLTALAAVPADFTCAGADHSPPLSWTAGPSGTLSYAIVLQDTTITFNHWVMWDIPPATTMLPESLPTDAMLTAPAGAQQRAGQGMGYLGPCPNGTQHTYVFTLYALDVATLPGIMASSTTANLLTIIQGHDLASAALSTVSDAKKP